MAISYELRAALYTGSPRNTPDLTGIFQDVTVTVGVVGDPYGLSKKDLITVEILNTDSITTARTKVTDAAAAHVTSNYPNLL